MPANESRGTAYDHSGSRFRLNVLISPLSNDLVLASVALTAFRAGELRIRFKSAMSLNEILEHLPKLTEDEKRQLWNILDQQLADEGEESPEFLAELDAGIRASDQGARTYSLDEARQMVRDTVTRARR